MPAETFKVVRTNCVVQADGAETCDYRATWEDPTAGESDYHAADLYYLETKLVANQPGQTPQTKQFCDDTNTPANPNKTPLPSSNWAMSYLVDGPGALGACTKMAARLCGGYKFDSVADANEAHSPVDSRDEGQIGTVVTACANKIQASRGGFRFHRATGRYVQMVTLKNTGTDPITEPVTLLLYNLSNNATLFNQSGKTTCIIPTGTPYIKVNVGSDNILSPGESASVLLQFTNPNNQGITYDTRVRAGNGCL